MTVQIDMLIINVKSVNFPLALIKGLKPSKA